MKRKYLIAAVGVPLLLSLVVIIFTSLPWLILLLGLTTEPTPPRPEIKHAEFPFRLVYEINGERKVIEDTLICKFDGIGMNEGTGKYRKWKMSLASGNERITLLKEDKIEIYFEPGTPQYYMDDKELYGNYSPSSFPDAIIYDQTSKYAETRMIYEGSLLEKYRIKINDWKVAPPIQDTFS